MSKVAYAAIGFFGAALLFWILLEETRKAMPGGLSAMAVDAWNQKGQDLAGTATAPDFNTGARVTGNALGAALAGYLVNGQVTTAGTVVGNALTTGQTAYHFQQAFLHEQTNSSSSASSTASTIGGVVKDVESVIGAIGSFF